MLSFILAIFLIAFLIWFAPIIIAILRRTKIFFVSLLTILPFGIIFCLYIILATSGIQSEWLVAFIIILYVPFYIAALICSFSFKREGTKITNEDTLENLENKVKREILLQKLNKAEVNNENINDLENLEIKLKKAKLLQELNKLDKAKLNNENISDLENLEIKLKKAKLLQELKEIEQKNNNTNQQ